MISTLQKIIVGHPAAIVIADPSQFDCPLVAVNESFERMTGHRAAEVIGRNCRFLQTDGTDRAEVARIREAVEQREHLETCILNKPADGSLFHNFLIISPIWRADGPTYLLGSQYELEPERTAPETLLRHRDLIREDPALSAWSDGAFRRAARAQSRDAAATRAMVKNYLAAA